MFINTRATLCAVTVLATGSAIVGSEAFVPTSLPPSETARGRRCTTTGHAKSSFAGNEVPVTLRSMPSSTSTSLSMMVGNGNLFDRFYRVVRSNVNKFVSSIENPEKVIVQAVDDMQSDLIKVRQAYAEATASQRRMQRQKDQVAAVANDWYHRAQLALQRNNEGLAREALARRQVELDKANTLRMQMDTQNVAIDKLYTAMNALENKIREAAATKEQLVARARTAKTTAAVNDMLSGLTGKTAMDAFNRMQEKVEALEAAAEASAEMNLLPSGVDSSLESEFRMLEQSSAVDQELEKMKKNMNETRLLGSSISLEESFRERVKIPVEQGMNKYQ